ncbi:beta-ketoacyl-ACP synthase [Enterovirga rhinocerotis]|uniref:3-oxoacyl-[acyl-carrier-protein] synthase II n=1 Tax=Enterovirga rhinocerotis TaxID=1339210 RepID=A0A4R7C604_9HYPH|nr:beta-ketoacyl-ACP synthase [Enterovirga rhinocerotis]TDR93523.1 3-oxoacyl-[acyl-carrier-protein] synthase II [Enterovirga rhinocerotis]
MRRSVVVTGIGIVSALGEGIEAHLAAIAAGGHGPVKAEPLSGYPVHAVTPLEWDRQIPKKSDQRQMEAWQRLGCYAAGLALDAAGAKEDPALKGRMQLVVAAGGGERDFAVDGQILTGLREAADPGAYLNEHLLSDLRPTLFLAQLSNLAAGNIAIVHGVTGASRTFMGEESAGVEALRIAEARIAAGQVDIMLAGGSYNAERPDGPLIYELGGFVRRDGFAPVAERGDAVGEAGFILGSAGAFLVLESEEHAAARGAKALARIEPVVSVRTRREPGSVSQAFGEAWPKLGAARPDRVISGATGIAPITAEESAALDLLAPGATVSHLGDFIGHPMEASAPAAAAVAAGLVASGAARDVVATSVGHRRGEGLVRLTAPD